MKYTIRIIIEMKLIINKIANSSMSIFLFFILSEMEERENFAPFKITRFFFLERDLTRLRHASTNILDFVSQPIIDRVKEKSINFYT